MPIWTRKWWALSELNIAKSKVGCRMLRLDCHDELVLYYKGLGFKCFCKNEAGTLDQMVTFIRFLTGIQYIPNHR